MFYGRSIPAGKSDEGIFERRHGVGSKFFSLDTSFVQLLAQSGFIAERVEFPVVVIFPGGIDAFNPLGHRFVGAGGKICEAVQVAHKRGNRLLGEDFAVVEDDIETVLEQIEIVAKQSEAKILIIDNITWLTSKSESGDAAAQLMSRLITMKKRGGYSILVLAHTPKRNTNAPLNQNSLAGSKKIANFMDSIFALGTSKKNRPSSRYIKQIKVRSCEMTYGEDNVIEVNITKDGPFLHMVECGNGSERENLDEPDEQDIARDEADEEIARRLKDGESYRTIIKELGVSNNRVSRVRQRLKEQPLD